MEEIQEGTTKNIKSQIVNNEIERVWVYDKYNQWICLEESESRLRRQKAENLLKKEEERRMKAEEFKKRLEEEGAEIEEITKEKEEWEKQVEEEKVEEEKEKKKEEEKQKKEDEFEKVEEWDQISSQELAVVEGKGVVFLVKNDDKLWSYVDKNGVHQVDENQISKGLKVKLIVHTEEGTYENEVRVDANQNVENFLGEFLKKKLEENFTFCSFGTFFEDRYIEITSEEITQVVKKEEKKKENDDLRANEKQEYEKSKKETEEKNVEIQKKIDEFNNEKKKREEEEAAKKKTEEPQQEGEKKEEKHENLFLNL